MRTFELELSWMMTTNVLVEARSAEDAEQYACSMGQPDGGNFVPFSIDVGSVEELDPAANRRGPKLVRVK